MAIFKTKIEISSVDGKYSKKVALIVDTGAFLSIVPADILKKIKVKPYQREMFVLANGEKIERNIGSARFRWNGKQGTSDVVFGEKGDKPLLGAHAIEAMGLKVNPRKRSLETEELLLL